MTATDDANHETSVTYTLQVADANDSPTTIALSGNSIDENTVGMTVGTLTTSDVDPGDSHTRSEARRVGQEGRSRRSPDQ